MNSTACHDAGTGPDSELQRCSLGILGPGFDSRRLHQNLRTTRIECAARIVGAGDGPGGADGRAPDRQSTAAQFDDHLVVVLLHRLHRQTGALEQQHATKLGHVPQLTERQEVLQRLHVAHVNHVPKRFFRRALGIEMIGLRIPTGVIGIGGARNLACELIRPKEN